MNATRWLRKAVRSPTVAALEIGMAVFSLVMFATVFGTAGSLALAEHGFGGVDYVTFLVPAVAVQAAMSTAIASGIGTVQDMRTGMFEKVVVSPMRWPAVLAGKALAELFRIACYVVIVVGLGVAMGATVETGPLGVVGAVVVCLLFAVWYMSLSNALAAVTGDEELLDAAGNLMLFPALFLSSAFLPLATLPPAVRTVAAVNPVTYAVDAVRALLLGRDALSAVTVAQFGGIWGTLVPSLAVLLALDVAFGVAAVSLLSRTRSRDLR